MARRIFLLVLLISWLTANLLWGAEWQFRGLGNLGGDFGSGKSSQAFGISGDGQFVAGDSLATAGLGITTGTEALLWTRQGAIIRVGTLSTKHAESSAKAVSNPAQAVSNAAARKSVQGRVVVGEGQTEDGKRAFRWSDSKDGARIESLGVLPEHDESVAWGVSGDGTVIVGESSSLSEELAFVWTAGKMVALGDLPGGKKDSAALAISLDGKTIVGRCGSRNGTEAFVWKDNIMQGLGSLKREGFESRAFGVSADGKVVVGESLSPRGYEAFRWDRETGMQPLGDLPEGEFESKASGVSADGNTIVGTANSENGAEAFVWTPTEGMQSLRQLLRKSGLPKGWRLQEACAVSSDGTVIIGIGQKTVGNGPNPPKETSAWIIQCF